ncbi:Outer membrane efflux protein [Pedobacter antarcticus]|uniref:Outer membrane efflux protein n=2 Tax=Pedobacter antarcticus TaxID=34086 RepID=A0A1I2AAM3_9SPHI|nr:TolC family protein [Pedobacter antarcticus]SFE40916.1 Outer membrane efflux protein [Pedobacter antarcticus]
MGRYPVKIARDTNTLNVAIPQRLHMGLPSTVLLSRPDIREAELELKAAKADIYAARKAMLPALTLTAYSGYNAFKLPLLFSPGSLASGFLGGLTAPVLNRAAIKTEFSQANSAQLNAYYNYQQKLLQGYQEVSTQLSAMDNYHQAMLLKERQVKELKEALSTANDLYLAGYASYLEVIVAQGSVLDAEVEFVRMKKASGTALISLFRSIGGV